MGTVYELLGQNKLALQWIKKAVKIDPTSHDHSEWLHVKILEAKIAGEHLITNQFLIGTDFGADTLPKTKLSSEKLQELRNAIYYQLNERVSFIKPKDKIVALLLFELGNICAITDDATSALRIYDRAKEYGYTSEVFDWRYHKLLKMQIAVDNEYTEKAHAYIKQENTSKETDTTPIGDATPTDNITHEKEIPKTNSFVVIATIIVILIAMIGWLLKKKLWQ